MSAPEQFDVVVVGGGSAGIAAAVSAARVGARTLLVERTDRLGGNVAHALVHTICGLYRPAVEGSARFAHAGFPRQFADRLRTAGGAGTPERAGKVYVLPIEPGRFADVGEATCRATAGLTWRRECAVVGADMRDGSPALLALDGAEGGSSVRAMIVVDTSGEGGVGALVGADSAMASADALQLPSFIFRMTGVEVNALAGFARLKVSHAVAGAVRGGMLATGCESVLVRPAMVAGDAWLTLNVPRPATAPYAPLDSAYIAALGREARVHAEAIAAFLRATRPAFACARVAQWPRQVGIRETRRLRGRAELTRTEILDGKQEADEVAVSTWPIELWDDHQRPYFGYPSAPCSVPLGALVSRSHPTLGMAGRCVSATHEALGALRVIGTSMATGEAVGVAAALAADSGGTLAGVAASTVRDRLQTLAEAGA